LSNSFTHARSRFVPAKGMAFGVDPTRPERYSLRQARYDALAHDVDHLARAAARRAARLAVLDIGSGAGSTSLHLRARRSRGDIDLDGADLDLQYNLARNLYRSLFLGDLTLGYPEIASNAYDVVICEQVLEHLHELDVAMSAIGRLLKPGGRAFVGVPIFVPPLHLARRHLVPILDKLLRTQRRRDHVQAFCLSSFKTLLIRHTGLRFVEARGFRIISGGVLRPLENFRWWWRFNRWLGARIPGACIEVQVILEKPIA